MKKLESTLPNMFLVLTAIALISAAGLGFTYAKTKPILDELARQRQIAAVAEVVPEFDNTPTEEAFTVQDFPDLELYPATRNGERVGTAVRSYSPNGYGGTISVMVGFGPDGTITGSAVLHHAETPGLGAKMTEEPFKGQFVGMTARDGDLAVAKDGGSVDAITAATISSRAYVDAINRAWHAVVAMERGAPTVPAGEASNE